MLREPTPVYVADRFEPLHAALLALLRGLDNADWQRATVAGAWRVADVVAHLLDGDLRRIALLRDAHSPPPDAPIADEAALVACLDALNADWVRAARRLSPALLVELLAFTGPRVAALVRALDPDSPAAFPVAWAGHAVSPNWFETGRELTERWHHQQQIRLAVGATPLDGEEWLRPVLSIALHVLPHAYRATVAAAGTAVVLDIAGAAGGTWSIVRGHGGWRLFVGAAEAAACRIAVTDIALSRTLHQLGSGAAAAVTGDALLAAPCLSARAIQVVPPQPGTPPTSGARPT